MISAASVCLWGGKLCILILLHSFNGRILGGMFWTSVRIDTQDLHSGWGDLNHTGLLCLFCYYSQDSLSVTDIKIN